MSRRTCRTCLKSMNSSECVRLQNSVQALEIEAELRFCMPEINFNLIGEAYMCCTCVDSLHNSYLFKNECLRSEERIRNFITANQDKEITLEELSVNNSLDFNVDVIDELNTVLDEVLRQNLPQTSNKLDYTKVMSDVVYSINAIDDADDSMYTFSQDIAESSADLCGKSCEIVLTKVSVQPGQVRFACSDCDEMYTNRFLLRQHVTKSHSKLRQGCRMFRRYARSHCNMCRFVSVHKKFTKSHMSRVHQQCKIVMCPVNGYKCVQNGGQLATFDSGEISPAKKRDRSTTCPICDKFISDSRNLSSHARKHVGPLPFFCARCRFRSASKEELKEHLLTHNQGTYACEPCGFYTDKYRSIRLHREKMHRGKILE